MMRAERPQREMRDHEIGIGLLYEIQQDVRDE
jgi:hypothetical protein